MATTNTDYVSCYCALQAHLRQQYRSDLADMKSAIEKTLGNDPQAQLKLGSKLQLLQTALTILDRNFKEASLEEYNALVHLGGRIKSAVELYRNQKAKRTASRAAAAQPVFAAAPAAMLPPADPSWEIPLDFISSLIADERKRLSPVPEQRTLRQEATPSHHAHASTQAAQVNPFMQQALAIAQGRSYGDAGASAAAAPAALNGSLNLPPVPRHPGAARGAVSLDLTGFGRRQLGNGRAMCSTPPAAGGASGPALALASSFYAAGSSGGMSSGSERVPTSKRPASVLGDDEGEEQCSAAQDSEGSMSAGGRGNRAKYRSVSFDQPRTLRPLRSCPEIDFQGFWRPEDVAAAVGSGVAGPAAAAGAQPVCRSISMDRGFESLASLGLPTTTMRLQGAPVDAAISPFAHLAHAPTLAPQQAAHQVALEQPEISLGPVQMSELLPSSHPQQAQQQQQHGMRAPSPAGGGDALLQQRQRQWQQLLALRLAQQQSTGDGGALPLGPLKQSGTSAGQGSVGSISVSQILLQGLPPEVGPTPPEQQPLAAAGAAAAAGGAQLDPAKRGKVMNSPTSTPDSSTFCCSNEAPWAQQQQGAGVGAAGEAPPAPSGAGAAAAPANPVSLQPPSLPTGAALTAATARLRLTSELSGQGLPVPSQDWPMDSLEHLLLEAASRGQGAAQAGAAAAGTGGAGAALYPAAGRGGEAPQGPSAPSAAANSLAGAAGGGFGFGGAQPMDISGEAADPTAHVANGSPVPLITSGLLPLTDSTYDALTVQLQPSFRDWTGQAALQRQVQPGGVAAEPAGPGSQRDAGGSGGLVAAEPLVSNAEETSLGINGGAGGGWSSPFDSSCGLLAQMGLGDEAPPSAFAAAAADGGGRSSEPMPQAHEMPPVTMFAAGTGALQPGGASTMMQAPSLPLNIMDTTRFDSLLFELGPDFLPDFDGSLELDGQPR